MVSPEQYHGPSKGAAFSLSSSSFSLRLFSFRVATSHILKVNNVRGTATARKIQKSVAKCMVFVLVWNTTKFVPKNDCIVWCQSRTQPCENTSGCLLRQIV